MDLTIPTKVMEFTRIYDWFGCVDFLAKLAKTERWEHKDKTGRPARDQWNPILESYLKYTFERIASLYNAAQGEEKRKWVTETQDGVECCFHTGLCTKNYSGIYMVCIRNENKQDRQKWEYLRFTHEDDIRLVSKFELLPSKAIYFSEEEKFIFDPDKELRVNMSHILSEENTSKRLPKALLNDPMIISRLMGAIEVAKLRARYDYHSAILHFYDGHINWLLPLCLSDPDKAEAFLSVRNISNDRNIGITILTPDMAYQNARLLAPVSSPWLQ